MPTVVVHIHIEEGDVVGSFDVDAVAPELTDFEVGDGNILVPQRTRNRWVPWAVKVDSHVVKAVTVIEVGCINGALHAEVRKPHIDQGSGTVVPNHRRVNGICNRRGPRDHRTRASSDQVDITSGNNRLCDEVGFLVQNHITTAGSGRKVNATLYRA